MASQGTLILPNREDAHSSTAGFRHSSGEAPYPFFYGIRFVQVAFPDCQDVPSGGAKLPGRSSVALLVGFELAQPEISPGCRSAATTLAVVPMPKAAVNKDGYSRVREDEIGGTGKILEVPSRAIPEFKQHCMNEFLGGGTAGFDAPHDGRSLLCG